MNAIYVRGREIDRQIERESEKQKTVLVTSKSTNASYVGSLS